MEKAVRSKKDVEVRYPFPQGWTRGTNWFLLLVLYFIVVEYHFHPTNVTNVWKVMSLANSSCGSEIGQTLRGLSSDKVRIFLFHRKFQKSLKSTNFEHVKTLNSSLWKSKTEITRKNFGMEKKNMT